MNMHPDAIYDRLVSCASRWIRKLYSESGVSAFSGADDPMLIELAWDAAERVFDRLYGYMSRRTRNCLRCGLTPNQTDGGSLCPAEPPGEPLLREWNATEVRPEVSHGCVYEEGIR